MFWERRYLGDGVLNTHFQFTHDTDSLGIEHWIVAFPFWILVGAAFIWPVIAAVRWILANEQVGHCPACNYDLRGSKESATCPECGEAITEKSVGGAEG